MSKILITGSTGFVGKHRTRHLMDLGHEVIGIGHARNIPPDFGVTEYITDITNREEIKFILDKHQPDRIEHYASISTVSVSRNNPLETYRVNVLGTVNILDLAKLYNLPVMCFTTDKVYGYASQIADEGTFLQADAGEYENSKTCQDLIAQSYNLRNLNKITIIRSCNIFGSNDNNSRIIPNTIKSLIQRKHPVIFTNINTIRQFIYIKDLMSAIDLIIEKGQGEIFNIGTDIYISQEDVVKRICSIWLSKYKSVLKPDYLEVKDMKELKTQLLVWEKLKTLGWQPKYTFEQAIKEMI